MTATARVALVIDNTRTQKQRSKRSVPTQSFLTDKHSIYGGKAEIVRTQQSGGYWHFRMWISEESKYVRKTLKTKHLDTAIERAENEFFAIKANLNSGKRIFSPTVQQAAEDYLKHRWEVDVKRGSITEGRWGTIKSQLNHFVAYCGIVGRSERSSITRPINFEMRIVTATAWCRSGEHNQAHERRLAQRVIRRCQISKRQYYWALVGNIIKFPPIMILKPSLMSGNRSLALCPQNTLGGCHFH